MFLMIWQLFSNEYGMISYMFTIVKGNIADVAKKEKRMAASNEQVKNNTIECGDLSAIGSKKQGKDISRFLIDDEL